MDKGRINESDWTSYAAGPAVVASPARPAVITTAGVTTAATAPEPQA